MSQIDFRGITQTIQGLKCQYIGERVNWPGVHVFAVYNGTAELFCYYDNQGRRVEFCGSKGEWVVMDNRNTHQIIKPPRKVQVTRWLCFKHVPTYTKDDQVVVYLCSLEPTEEHVENGQYLKIEKHTWNIEVPE